MDSYSSTTKTDYSSSASYTYLSNSSTQFPYDQFQQQAKRGKPRPAFRSALHSVRKFPAKNIISKKATAPSPATPPKVYKVDPVDFKDIVQKLTGAAELQPTTRLQEVAPPPLSLPPPHRPKPKQVSGNDVMAEDEGKLWKSFDNTFGALSPLGFGLSPPSSRAWCSATLLSPGALSSLEPNVVL